MQNRQALRVGMSPLEIKAQFVAEMIGVTFLRKTFVDGAGLPDLDQKHLPGVPQAYASRWCAAAGHTVLSVGNAGHRSDTAAAACINTGLRCSRGLPQSYNDVGIDTECGVFSWRLFRTARPQRICAKMQTRLCLARQPRAHP